MERNPFLLRDVRGDTHIALEKMEKVRIGGRAKSTYYVTVAPVIALKKCGCNGPTIGQVQTVPEANWPDDIPTIPTKGKAQLWAAYVTASDEPVGYAWNAATAATKVRSWHAVRNIKTVMRKQAEHRGLSQAKAGDRPNIKPKETSQHHG